MLKNIVRDRIVNSVVDKNTVTSESRKMITNVLSQLHNEQAVPNLTFAFSGSALLELQMSPVVTDEVVAAETCCCFKINGCVRK